MIQKLELRSGGLLMLSVLVLVLDVPLLLAVLGNVFIHEWGHLTALSRYGVYIRNIYVEFTGFRIVCNREFLSQERKWVCAAAGPFAGICGAVATSVLGNLLHNEFLLLFAGVGLILSLFNLLPIKQLDGGQMLCVLAPRVSDSVSVFCCSLIFLAGLYIMVQGYGTALAILGTVLLLQDESVGGNRRCNCFL